MMKEGFQLFYNCGVRASFSVLQLIQRGDEIHNRAEHPVAPGTQTSDPWGANPRADRLGYSSGFERVLKFFSCSIKVFT